MQDKRLFTEFLLSLSHHAKHNGKQKQGKHHPFTQRALSLAIQKDAIVNASDTA